MNILQDKKFKCRVSSVLNRNAKEFGKQYLFDSQEDTCWNSEQGCPQWIDLELEECRQISAFKLQFQGGFVGQDCVLQASVGDSKTLENIQPFYPEDVNVMQTFILKELLQTNHLRFLFNKSTDFFGRIIIYKLEILS